jgi:hypothetical protein
MSGNDTAAAPGAEPASPDHVNGGGEQPLADDASANAIASIRGIDDIAELERLYLGDDPENPQPESSRPSQSQAEPPIAPDPEAALAAGEDPPPAATEPEAPATRAPDRIHLRALKPEDRTLVADAVQMVRDGKSTNIVAALVALGVQAPPAAAPAPHDAETPAPQAQTPTPVEAPTPDANVTKLAEEITSLRNQRRKAKEEFDSDLEMSLTEQIEDKVAELGEARSQAKLAQADKGSKIQQSIQDVIAKYPESDDTDSDFSNRLNELLDLAHYRQDPRLDQPDYLMVFADQVANELGKGSTPQRAAAPHTPSNTAPPPAPPRARPVGQVAPGHAGQSRLTPEQARQAIQTATPEQLAEALYG